MGRRRLTAAVFGAAAIMELAFYVSGIGGLVEVVVALGLINAAIVLAFFPAHDVSRLRQIRLALLGAVTAAVAVIIYSTWGERALEYVVAAVAASNAARLILVLVTRNTNL